MRLVIQFFFPKIGLRSTVSETLTYTFSDTSRMNSLTTLRYE